MLAVPPSAKVAGAPLIVMLSVPELDTLMVADATTAWLLVEVAVIVTEPPAVGAVNVVLAPLAV
jgi:hypothetical protein